MTQRTVVITAGEASADRHASAVMRAVKEIDPAVVFIGMGGPEMVKAGLDCSFSMDEISVMGFSGVASRISRIARVYNGLKRLMEERRPDLFIPVDLPDFNMRLARYAKHLGIKVLYYIAPQAWAWRRSRACVLSRVTDGLAVIFPFEEGFFRSYGVNARYVGHPLLDGREPGSVAVHDIRWPPSRIGIMPGSRPEEIRHILPVMTRAKRIIERDTPGLTWHLPVAPGLDASFVKGYTDGDVELTRGLPLVDAAMVKSGTSSLEAALRGTPSVICYKTGLVNYTLARLFVKVDHIGMPNLIAGRPVLPELVQRDLTPERLAGALSSYLKDPDLFEATRAALLEIRGRLGSQSASRETAKWALNLMEAS